MRAIARLFGLGCVWPALGNLTRRKLRGLVEPYGDVKQVCHSCRKMPRVCDAGIELMHLRLFCGGLFDQFGRL